MGLCVLTRKSGASNNSVTNNWLLGKEEVLCAGVCVWSCERWKIQWVSPVSSGGGCGGRKSLPTTTTQEVVFFFWFWTKRRIRFFIYHFAIDLFEFSSRFRALNTTVWVVYSTSFAAFQSLLSPRLVYLCLCGRNVCTKVWNKSPRQIIGVQLDWYCGLDLYCKCDRQNVLQCAWWSLKHLNIERPSFVYILVIGYETH